MFEFLSIAILNIIAKLLKFAFEIGMSYFVDKQTYGYFAILLSYMLIYTRISTFGTPNLMVRELSGRENNLQYVSYLLFNVLFIEGSIVIIGIVFIKLVHIKYLSSFVDVPFIVFFNAFLISYAVFLRVKNNIRLWIFFQDISWYIFYFVGFSIFILFFKININIDLVLKIYFLAIFLSLILLLFFLKYKYQFKFISKISLKRIRHIVSQSFPILFTGLTYLILSRIDVIMLGNYVNLSLVGEYNIVARVTIQTLFVYQVISSYFYPRLAKRFARKEKYKGIKKYVTNFILISFLSVLSLNMILFILIKYFNLFGILKISHTRVLFEVFVIFAVTQIIYSTISVYGYILLYINKQKIEYINNVIILIIGLILNFILIPKHGVVGASIATISAILLGCILEVLEVKLYTSTFFIGVK